MSVMNDRMIRDWALDGGVTPFDPAMVNPASIDLRYSGRWRWATNTPERWTAVNDSDELRIEQGQLFLLDTIEYVTMPIDYGGMLMLKSSMGRLGLEHLHAGWFDPAFSGTATLEVTNLHPFPVTLKRGQPIVQLVLMKMAQRPSRGYDVTGRYNGQNSPQVAR